MLNAYPVGYSLANDIKYTGRDRPYEYLERTNSLGTNMLDQSMNMGASNSMDYKYSSSHLQGDGSYVPHPPLPACTPHIVLSGAFRHGKESHKPRNLGIVIPEMSPFLMSFINLPVPSPFLSSMCTLQGFRKMRGQVFEDRASKMAATQS